MVNITTALFKEFMASKTETVVGLPTVALPFGLSKLLECMIRAVLIENPDNIARFLADYSSEMLLYRNENPSMDLKEVMVQFQNRRETMTRSKSRSEKVKKRSGESSVLTSQEASLLGSKEIANGEDRTQSSKVTPTESVPEIELQQETPLDEAFRLSNNETSDGIDRTHSSEVSVRPPENVLDVELIPQTPLVVEVALLYSEESSNGKDRTQSSEVSVTSLESVLEVELLQETAQEEDKHLVSGQTSKSEVQSGQMPSLRSSAKDIQTETKELVPSERLSLSLSSFLSSEAAAASYPSAISQSPGPTQVFRTSTSLEEEANPQNMWTLYHLPHREEEGTLSTTVLSQPQYQNGAQIQVIGPGYVLVTKCPSTGTQSEETCIRSNCSKVNAHGSGKDCLVIKPPPYEHNNI